MSVNPRGTYPGNVPGPRTPSRLPPPERRHRTVATAALVVLVLLVGGALVLAARLAG